MAVAKGLRRARSRPLLKKKKPFIIYILACIIPDNQVKLVISDQLEPPSVPMCINPFAMMIKV